MVCDFGRIGYRQLVQPWRNSNATLTIRWYRAPPGARYLPIPSRFRSQAWESTPWEWTGVGEVWGDPPRWSNGATPPTAHGLGFVGNPEDFALGGIRDPLVSVERDPWGLIAACSAFVHGLVGGEAEGGTLRPAGRLVGGEAEGGTLQILRLLVGGEAEGGTLRPAGRLVGGEAEGGTLRPAGRLVGGEAEGSTLRLSGETVTGGEAEGGFIYLSGLTVSGGEAEGGLLISTQLIGGEDDSGQLVSLTLIGGEVEGGLVRFFALIGGEAEGGTLRPAGRLVGGEAEGGWLSKDIPLVGGEAEGGALTFLPTVRLDGGEAEGGVEFQATISADLWLDATRLVLSQGDPVSLWADRSGNGNDATQGTPANQPSYDPVGGAAPCVLFDFSLRLLLTSPIQGGSGWTTYVVMRPKTQNMVISSITGSSTNPQSARPGVTWKVGFGSDINVSFDTLSVWGLAWPWDATRTDLVSCRRNGLNWSLQADGYFPAGYNPVSSSGPLVSVDTVNAVGPVGGQYLGWVYEIVCFNRALTDEEDHSIVNYLGRKWRVPGF